MWNDDLLQFTPRTNSAPLPTPVRSGRTLPRFWPRHRMSIQNSPSANVAEPYGSCHTTVTGKR